jgi:hypothetical protein
MQTIYTQRQIRESTTSSSSTSGINVRTFDLEIEDKIATLLKSSRAAANSCETGAGRVLSLEVAAVRALVELNKTTSDILRHLSAPAPCPTPSCPSPTLTCPEPVCPTPSCPAAVCNCPDVIVSERDKIDTSGLAPVGMCPTPTCPTPVCPTPTCTTSCPAAVCNCPDPCSGGNFDVIRPRPAHECKCHCAPVICPQCAATEAPSLTSSTPAWAAEPTSPEADEGLYSSGMHFILLGIIGVLALVLVLAVVVGVREKFRADLSEAKCGLVERELEKLGRDLVAKTVGLAAAEDRIAQMLRPFAMPVANGSGPFPPPPPDGSAVQGAGQVSAVADVSGRRAQFSMGGGQSVLPRERVLEDVEAARALVDELSEAKK